MELARSFHRSIDRSMGFNLKIIHWTMYYSLDYVLCIMYYVLCIMYYQPPLRAKHVDENSTQRINYSRKKSLKINTLAVFDAT